MITATAPDALGRTRSTTRQALLRLAGVLLGLSAIVAVTSVATFMRVHTAVGTAADRTAPAITQLVAARMALVRADGAAIGSLSDDAAQLVGPGEEFQNQIAIASQSLNRVAETNMGGEAASRSLRFVEALLVTYTGLVGEATARSGSDRTQPIAVAALWNASRLLHQKDQDSGILAKLDSLIAVHRQVLHDEQSTAATTPWGAVLLFVPAASLLVMLLFAQWFWRRRFRRKLSLLLATATVALMALAALSSLAFPPSSRLDTAAAELRALDADARAQASSVNAQAQQNLQTMLDAACDDAACKGYVDNRFSAVDTQPDAPTARADDSLLTEGFRRVGEQTGSANANAGLVTLIYLLGVLLGATILLGFRVRLIEYRYRPR